MCVCVYMYMVCNGVLTLATKTNPQEWKLLVRKFSSLPSQKNFYLTSNVSHKNSFKRMVW